MMTHEKVGLIPPWSAVTTHAGEFVGEMWMLRDGFRQVGLIPPWSAHFPLEGEFVGEM